MGRTNRKTLNNLLDELEGRKTSNSTGTVSGNQFLEIAPSPGRETSYDASWTPCNTGNIAEKVKQAADHNEIKIPSSVSPSPCEIARFMPVVKGRPEIVHPRKACTDSQLSIEDLTSDHQRFLDYDGCLVDKEANLDKLKLAASLLEDYYIAWQISEIHVKYEDFTDMHTAFLEVGVPNTSSNYEEEFITHLRDAYKRSGKRSKLPYIVSTITRDGYTFYPLYSRVFSFVPAPGALKVDAVNPSNKRIKGYRHTGVIKESP